MLLNMNELKRVLPMRTRAVGWVVMVLLVAQMSLALGQGTSTASAGSSSTGGALATQECKREQCFSSEQARKDFAAANSCYFLEDICTDHEDPKENQANQADRGFWGSLWDAGVGAIQYGYNFVRGLVAGLGDQIKDLWDLVSDPVEAAKGLAELGKRFYEDPEGTVKALGQVLGDEVTNAILRATRCGAYDLGRVIGQNINPVVVLRLGTQLARFGGKLDDAVAATRRDLGCASFVAGTPVWLSQGRRSIEQIRAGDLVFSRDEKLWKEAPQRVIDVFGRTAPDTWVLVTERETYRLTEEHPVWVQGKGWTEVKAVSPGDVLSAAQGDTLVISNEAGGGGAPVFNFSVDNTPSYFVGEDGLWAHNTGPCAPNFRDYFLGSKKPKDLDSGKKGYWGELNTKKILEENGYEAKVAVGDGSSAYADWVGKTGIDGIYKKDGKWVIVESKTTGSTNVKDPCDTTGKLCTLSGGERQMSDKWIIDRVNNNPNLTPSERKEIIDGLENGDTSRVLSRTDGDGNTNFYEIERAVDSDGNPSKEDVRVGSAWRP